MLIVEKFEQILLDFFKVHHPRKIKKVPQLVEEFKGKEVEMLKALCIKYRKDFSVIPEYDTPRASSADLSSRIDMGEDMTHELRGCGG